MSSKYIWIRQLVLQHRLSTSREHVLPEGVTKLFSDDQGHNQNKRFLVLIRPPATDLTHVESKQSK
jgi:hypothetical protein